MTRAAIYKMQVQVQVTNCGSRDQLSPGLSILKLGIVKCGVATRCQMLQGCFGFRIFPLERYFALCGPCVCACDTWKTCPSVKKVIGSRPAEAADAKRTTAIESIGPFHGQNQWEIQKDFNELKNNMLSLT